MQKTSIKSGFLRLAAEVVMQVRLPIAHCALSVFTPHPHRMATLCCRDRVISSLVLRMSGLVRGSPRRTRRLDAV